MPTNKVAKDDTLQSLVSAVEDIAELMGEGIQDLIPEGASSSNKLATASDVTGLQSNVIANTKLIKDTVGWSGKNKLKTLPNITNANVTISARSDGGYDAQSTSITSVNYRILNPEITSFMLPVGIYKLSVTMTDTENNLILCFVDGSNWTEKARVKTGQVAQFEVTANDVNKKMALFIGNSLTTGSAVNNVIYPMITDVDILDQSYEPHFNSTAFPRSEQAVLGAKNFIKRTYNGGTSVEVTAVINADESITFNGTATGGTFWCEYSSNATKLKKGTYKVSGLPATGSGTTFDLFIRKHGETAGTDFFENDSLFVVSEDATYDFFVTVRNGYTANNLTFKPMIRLASDPDDTYAPYAMTNRELTDVVNGITVKSFTTEQFTVAAGQYSPQEISIANGDLIPLGVVGYRIDGNGNTECGMWKNWMDISTKKVLFGIKNFSANATATVTVTIFVLYKG